MKYALKTMLLLTIVLNVKAQSVNVVSADLLANIRFTFNKKMIKEGTCNEGQLPVSKFLFRHGGESEVYIEGLTFLTKYNSIVGIKGLYLSEESLKHINDRMCLLDRLQQAYSEATNKEYQSGEKNRYQIILNDRKFFTILRAIKSTARDIKKIYESDLSLKEKSDAMAKMRFANVDWQLYSRILETENQKMVASKEK